MRYNGGIITGEMCPGQDGLDHAITAVGHRIENGRVIVRCKNSWGNRWGENGYVDFDHASNPCNFHVRTTAPIVDGRL